MVAKLNIGWNWDPALIDGLTFLDTKYGQANDTEICTVYGSTNGDGPLTANPIGTARPPQRIKTVTDLEFINQTERLLDLGIGFNYTLNASCIDIPRLFEGAHLKKYIKAWLQELSTHISMFTVAHPLLIEELGELLPDVPIEASIIMDIKTPGQLTWIHKHWPNVKKVCISLDRNRDFDFLGLADSLCNMGKAPEIEVLANEFCSIGGNSCSGLYRQSCYMAHSHGYFMLADNYPMRECTASRWEEPESWIKARFILPQWMDIYEGVGISHFKISGRTHPTSYIMDIAEAYLKRNYTGNLLGLWAQLESIWHGHEGQSEALAKFSIPAELIDECSGPSKRFLQPFLYGKKCSDTACGTFCEYCRMVFDVVQAIQKVREEDGPTRA